MLRAGPTMAAETSDTPPGSRTYEALDLLPIAAGVIRDGRFVLVNQALADLLATPRERFVGMPFTDPVAPEDRDRVRERHVLRLRGEPVPDSYELQLIRGDGSRRTVEIFVRMRAPDVVFQLVDRTMAVAHRERLTRVAQLGARIQAERDAGAILEAVGAGLTEVGVVTFRLVPDDDAMRIAATTLPPAAVAAFETQTGEKLVGLRGNMLPEIHEAWRAGSYYVDDMLQSAFQFVSAEQGSLARDIMRAHGLTRGIDLRLDIGGAPNMLLALAGDWLGPEDLPAFALFATQVSAALDAARVIDDLSRGHAELAALNQLAQTVTAVTDRRTLLADASSVIVAALGADAAGIYLIDPEQDDATLAYAHGATPVIAQAFSRLPLASSRVGDVARGRRTQVLHAGDFSDHVKQATAAFGDFTVIATPLLVRSNAIGVLMVAFFDRHLTDPRDVSLAQAMGTQLGVAVENARLYEDLRNSYGELARAQERLVARERLAALGEMAAVMAHEVRNPLGAIFNSIGALRKLMRPEGDAATLFDIMGEEAGRLNRIVSDLLDFANPSRPKLHVENIERVIEEAIHGALGAEHANVAVEIDVAPDVPSLQIDAFQIRQAVLNLLINSVQAMPRGGTISIAVRSESVGGLAHVRIDVADSGEGVPSDVQPRLFEPFFTTKAAGTGLGLAVVKRIVDSHHGTIFVRSAPGAGTTFVLHLPVDPGAP